MNIFLPALVDNSYSIHNHMPAIRTRTLQIQTNHPFREIGSAIYHVQRCFHASAASSLPSAAEGKDEPPNRSANEEPGAMSRKLEQLTEEALENSGGRAEKVIEEAGFSETLKKRLEARILDSKFRSENVQAFAEVSMPVCHDVTQRESYD